MYSRAVPSGAVSDTSSRVRPRYKAATSASWSSCDNPPTPSVHVRTAIRDARPTTG